MAYLVRVQCPDCSGSFSVRLEGEDDYPNYCQLCGSYVGPPEDFVPTQMNIGTDRGRAGDRTYRQIEASSLHRAEQAAEMMTQQFQQAGMSAEDAQRQAATAAREIKITDLNDRLREGDVAAKAPVRNIVTDYAQAAGSEYFQGGLSSSLGVNNALAKAGSGAPVLAAIQGGRGPRPSGSPQIQGKWGG